MSPQTEPGSAYFEEGAAARATREPLFDHPYIGTAERSEWIEGWRATFDLDEDVDPASNRERHDKQHD